MKLEWLTSRLSIESYSLSLLLTPHSYPLFPLRSLFAGMTEIESLHRKFKTIVNKYKIQWKQYTFTCVNIASYAIFLFRNAKVPSCEHILIVTMCVAAYMLKDITCITCNVLCCAHLHGTKEICYILTKYTWKIQFDPEMIHFLKQGLTEIILML